jgi:hypothetical protein
MKKQVKKLVLAKETVLNLSMQDLGEVVGGTNSEGCYTRTCNGWQWLTVGGSYTSACTQPQLT